MENQPDLGLVMLSRLWASAFAVPSACDAFLLFDFLRSLLKSHILNVAVHDHPTQRTPTVILTPGFSALAPRHFGPHSFHCKGWPANCRTFSIHDLTHWMTAAAPSNL